MKIKSNFIFRTLSSVKLAIPLLLTLMLTVALGTLLESRYSADFAKVYVYDSFFFYVLFFLLFLNILFATLSRIPYRRHHLGFVITHIGLMTMILGAFVTAQFGIDGMLKVTEGQSENKIELKELVLKYKDQSYDLKQNYFSGFFQKSDASFKIKQLIPFSEVKTDFQETKDPSDVAAVGFILKSSLFQNGDMLHLKEKPEINYGPLRLQLMQKTEVQTVDVNTIYFLSEKSDQILQRWNYKKNPKIKFHNYQFHFIQEYQNAIVSENGLIEGTRSNPALKIEVLPPGEAKKFNEILFVKHPEFSLNQNRYPGFHLSLNNDFASRTQLQDGKFLQVSIVNSQKAVVSIYENKSLLQQAELSPGQNIQLPWMGINFILGNILSHAKMNVEIKEAQIRSGQKTLPPPAVQIQSQDSLFWVSEEYQQNQDFTLTRKTELLPKSIRLQRFQKIDYLGTQQAKEFKSIVEVDGLGLKTISMNEPLQIQGYTLYQSSYDVSDPEHPISIFSVNKDPGRSLKYFGALILIIGIMVYTLMKSRLARQQRDFSK